MCFLNLGVKGLSWLPAICSPFTRPIYDVFFVNKGTNKLLVVTRACLTLRGPRVCRLETGPEAGRAVHHWRQEADEETRPGRKREANQKEPAQTGAAQAKQTPGPGHPVRRRHFPTPYVPRAVVHLPLAETFAPCQELRRGAAERA